MIDEMLTPVIERLEALSVETRRQGRASIAAQAAAESCASSVDAMRAEVSQLRERVCSERGDSGLEDLVRALMPVADAIDRVGEQSSKLTVNAKRPGFLARMFGATDPTMGLQALSDGLNVLGAQLEAAMSGMGVQVDREVGVAVDGQAHRVVEVRTPGPGDVPGVVIEIVRPGYCLNGKQLREADVAVWRAHSDLAEVPQQRGLPCSPS
jgi:molecular chaperone GrpE (heat shock protein)